MSKLFGKKDKVQAAAEVLEDGEVLTNQEFSRMKYQGDTHDRHFKPPTIGVAVRVQPVDRPPFDAKMETGAETGILLKPGVSVQVEFDAADNDDVRLIDDLPAILARNPQLMKQG